MGRDEDCSHERTEPSSSPFAGRLSPAVAQGTLIPLIIEVGKLGSVELVAQGNQPITLLPSSLKDTSTLTFPSDSKTGQPLKDSNGQPLKDVSVGSATYGNEGKSWWNVSVAAPLKAVKSIDYDANTLQPKTLDNKAAYAAFDVYLGKVDIQNPRFRLIPAVFLAGPSFTGKFLDRWLVGVSDPESGLSNRSGATPS